MGSSSSSEGRPIVMDCRGQKVLPPDQFECISFEPMHFDEGLFRYAFRGKIRCKESACDVRAGMRPAPFCGLGACIGWKRNRNGEYPCVVKKFKNSDAMFSSCWNKDVNLLLEAQKLAEQFNAICNDRLDYNYTINFATPFLVEVTHGGHVTEIVSPGGGAGGGVVGVVGGMVARAAVIETFASSCVIASGIAGFVVGGLVLGLTLASGRKPGECKIKERVCIEPHLDGKFEKLNSNNGWARRSSQSAVAQAFSHWTWFYTCGEMLLCDLQGTCNEPCAGLPGNWLLTDPAAHSLNPGKLGHTDLGPKGMDAFFREHTCNDLCRHLVKKVPEAGPPLPLRPEQRTSWSWEVITAENECLVRTSSGVHAQTGGTCYAHAVATVIRAAESRIEGRKLQEHESIVSPIIQKFGSNGADPEKVLRHECPKRRLHFRQVDRNEAVVALRAGRAIVFAFWLSDQQWHQFSNFFDEKPTCVLSANVFTSDSSQKKGHAVAITGQKHGIWNIKNSWGDSFADGGSFQMKWDALPASVTMFFDVYWFETDLTIAEKLAFLELTQA
eukprot:CAMPEP_0168408690 /NCGR_PEP_ID=MMETSP0228-20121227/26800_1 /TAXON_ID=133427 /ORGANISM="Protoceratium reticulatum, Strain CCCM 535 (=CCMP 1889)" /LENGTH=555 /DNA_ID=CAMNT_0008422383 /DNA_START=1 /DNA_END=1665 /DNA_ORIENTATION=-